MTAPSPFYNNFHTNGNTTVNQQAAADAERARQKLEETEEQVRLYQASATAKQAKIVELEALVAKLRADHAAAEAARAAEKEALLAAHAKALEVPGLADMEAALKEARAGLADMEAALKEAREEGARSAETITGLQTTIDEKDAALQAAQGEGARSAETITGLQTTIDEFAAALQAAQGEGARSAETITGLETKLAEKDAALQATGARTTIAIAIESLQKEKDALALSREEDMRGTQRLNQALNNERTKVAELEGQLQEARRIHVQLVTQCRDAQTRAEKALREDSATPASTMVSTTVSEAGS